MPRRMEVTGGIYVQHGERRPDQPFLVGFDAYPDAPYGDLVMVWTASPEEATEYFLIQVRRILKKGRKRRDMRWRDETRHQTGVDFTTTKRHPANQGRVGQG
jgi:hypothetical protein